MPIGSELPIPDAAHLAHDLLLGLLAEQAQGQSPLATFAFIGVLVAIFYLMLYRPQQKQAKEHKALLSVLKKGDVVVTNGGMVGRIHAVAEKSLLLEVARDVRVRVLISAIGGRAPEGMLEEPERSEAKKDEEKKK